MKQAEHQTNRTRSVFITIALDLQLTRHDVFGWINLHFKYRRWTIYDWFTTPCSKCGFQFETLWPHSGSMWWNKLAKQCISQKQVHNKPNSLCKHYLFAEQNSNKLKKKLVNSTVEQSSADTMFTYGLVFTIIFLYWLIENHWIQNQWIMPFL